MKRDIGILANKNYDLVVIGAGIFGACAAWDATQRGLSVALIEKSDFCQATSAHHFKMIHGGMRYLQHLDFKRVRESSYERSVLFRIAPHLAYPLPILMPTYGHGLKGKEILRAGLFVYEMLTCDRNQGIGDPERKLPRSRFIPPQEVLKLYPGLDEKDLTGAVMFYDGQIYNPPRLVLSFIRSAVNAGLDVANYLEVVDYVLKKNRVLGVIARDRLTEERLEIRGKLVLNTSGPWADSLNQKIFKRKQKSAPTFSRDLVIVVPKQLSKKYALAHLIDSRDNDALIDRGGRHIFIVPWRDFSLIGVWHQVFSDSPDEITVSDEELIRFIDEVNNAYQGLHITMDDVSMVNTGLILFGDERNQGDGGRAHSFGKRSILIDHEKEDKLEGLLSLIGVRATMARKEAEKTVDLILQRFGKMAKSSETSDTTIYGGKIEKFHEFVKQATDIEHFKIEPRVIRALIHNYGSEYNGVLKYASENKALAETVGNSTVLKAEVIHAVREEMAQKLEDVVFRRTDLGTAINPGKAAVRSCAELVAKELDWDEKKLQREQKEVNAIFLKRGPWNKK